MDFLKKILWGTCLCFLSQVTCASEAENPKKMSRRHSTHNDSVELVEEQPRRPLTRVNACLNLQNLLKKNPQGES
jgi:hypothetical protein